MANWRPSPRHIAWVIAALVAASVAVGVSAWRRATEPSWAVYLRSEVRFERPENGGPYSEEHYRTFEWLYNSLRHQAHWSVDDANRVAAIIQGANAIVTIDQLDADLRLREAWKNASMAITLAAERLQIGAPIDPTASSSLIRLLRGALDHGFAPIRHGAVTAVVSARLVEDPGVRVQVEAMQDDPDPHVASNAKRQLMFYDQYKAARARSKVPLGD